MGFQTVFEAENTASDCDMIGMFSGKRVVDGRVVYRPSLTNLAAETWQTNTSRDRAAMNHVLSNMVHPVHVRWHDT